MKVSEKVERAKEALASILRHDDEPIETIHAAVNELREFMNVELEEAETRRAEKEGE